LSGVAVWQTIVKFENILDCLTKIAFFSIFIFQSKFLQMSGNDQNADNEDGYANRVSQIMNQFNLLLPSKIAPI